MQVVTTWPSTPLTRRPAKLPWRSMGRVPPFVGRVSIGVVRSTHLVACVSPKFIFRTVQAHERASAGTRRVIYSGNWPHGVRGFLPSVPVRVSATDGSVRPVVRRELSSGRSEPHFVCDQVATSSESRTLRPAAGWFASRFRARRNIGEAPQRGSLSHRAPLYFSRFTSSATPAS